MELFQCNIKFVPALYDTEQIAGEAFRYTDRISRVDKLPRHVIFFGGRGVILRCCQYLAPNVQWYDNWSDTKDLEGQDRDVIEVLLSWPTNTILSSYRYTNLLSKIMMSLYDTANFDSDFKIKQGDTDAW
jgi:hypothetical protein